MNERRKKITIKAGKPWYHIPWGEIYDYRDLLYLLVRRDLIAQYKQTIFGPLLFFIQPLITTVVFTIFFGRVAGVSTDGIPHVPFYMSGIIFFTYFQNCMTISANSLTANAGILGKVYFPRLVVPLSSIFTGFATFMLNFAMFVGFYLYYLWASPESIMPNRWLFALPLMIILCAILGLGTGLWLSALSVKYRDLRLFIPVMAQMLLYATPVIYPLSNIEQPHFRLLMAFNPMASVVEFSRFAFFSQGVIEPLFMAIGICFSFAILFSGIFYFNKLEKTFVDVI